MKKTYIIPKVSAYEICIKSGILETSGIKGDIDDPDSQRSNEDKGWDDDSSWNW